MVRATASIAKDQLRRDSFFFFCWERLGFITKPGFPESPHTASSGRRVKHARESPQVLPLVSPPVSLRRRPWPLARRASTFHPTSVRGLEVHGGADLAVPGSDRAHDGGMLAACLKRRRRRVWCVSWSCASRGWALVPTDRVARGSVVGVALRVLRVRVTCPPWAGPAFWTVSDSASPTL